MLFSKNSVKPILFVFLLIMPLSMTWALENPNQAKTNVSVVKEKVEVIDVVGQKPLAYFRMQVEKAERDFYEAYNAVADNKKFFIRCRIEKRLGSNIKSRVCYPQYVIDRMAAETQEALSRGSSFPNLKDIEFAVTKEREESMEYVEKIVKENPQLLEKLLALNKKQDSYAAKKLEN